MTSPSLGHLAGIPLEIMNPLDEDTTYTKIFVGGLPYHTDDESLRNYFKNFGDVNEAVVIVDKFTGMSRGYGFVTMVDKAAAEQACRNANPIIDGRKANVNLAYLGARPRYIRTALSLGLQPPWPYGQFGLIQQYVVPETFVQPSLLLQSQPAPAVAAPGSPYLNYSGAYGHYGLEQYPCAPSPSPAAAPVCYSYPAHALPVAPAPPPPPPPHAALPTAAVTPLAYVPYPLRTPHSLH